MAESTKSTRCVHMASIPALNFIIFNPPESVFLSREVGTIDYKLHQYPKFQFTIIISKQAFKLIIPIYSMGKLFVILVEYINLAFIVLYL